MINSTAFEDTDRETKELAFVRSKTEIKLFQFAKDLDWENWKGTYESKLHRRFHSPATGKPWLSFAFHPEAGVIVKMYMGVTS